MKKIGICFLFALIFLGSCKKDDSTSLPGHFTLKFNSAANCNILLSRHDSILFYVVDEAFLNSYQTDVSLISPGKVDTFRVEISVSDKTKAFNFNFSYPYNSLPDVTVNSLPDGQKTFILYAGNGIFKTVAAQK
ncbi:MAG: hypothetical protein Q8907_12555 [Bacteroidota bacterium]|nr:hypothetical protein [Bacteroidota bacterium]